MAKEVGLRNNTAYSSGYNHGNVLRSKTQQFYSASNSEFRHGPKQERSMMQVVNADRRGDYSSQRADDITKQNDFSAYRIRSENVGRARPSVSLRERQSVDTGGIQDSRIAMSETRGGVQNEKEFFDKGIESYPRKERLGLKEDSRQSYNDERTFYNQSRSLSARNDLGRVQDVRSSSQLFIKPNSELSMQDKSQTVNTVDINSSGRGLLQGVEPKTNDSRVVSRSGSLDRRKVQVKQADIGVLSQGIDVVEKRLPEPEKNKRAYLEGSKFPNSAQKQVVAAGYRGVSKVDYPRRHISSTDQKAGAQDVRNDRYAKCSSSVDIISSSIEPQISYLDNTTGITASVLRHSFQEGDRKGVRKMYSDLPGMDVHEKHSHTRQGSDPTTHVTGGRKLSSMSQDLMRLVRFSKILKFQSVFKQIDY